MTYDFFIGEWTFERRIFTGENVQGTAKGTAVFSVIEKNKKLLYNERGELLLSEGGKFSFTRSFIYTFEGELLTLVYNDGENFGQHYQTYQPEGERLVSLDPHVCGADVYDGHFKKLLGNSYRQYVKVVGAKKDYESETVYNRLAELMSYFIF